MNATADTTTTDVPATFCEPGETIPTPGKSTFELAVTFLQDPTVSTGLNRFLFENDTEEAYFLLGFDGVNPPKAIGRVRLTAATIGGEARATLTADITLPLSRKPDIEFGNATTSVMIEGDGTVTPGDADGRTDPDGVGDGERRAGWRQCVLMPEPFTAAAATALSGVERKILLEAADRFDVIAKSTVARSVGGGSAMLLHGRGGRRRAVRLTTRRTVGSSVVFIEGVPAGIWTWLETGTKPHRIPKGRRKTFLSFNGVVRRSVRHPGTRGKRTWTQTVETFRREYPDIVTTQVKKALG